MRALGWSLALGALLSVAGCSGEGNTGTDPLPDDPGPGATSIQVNVPVDVSLAPGERQAFTFTPPAGTHVRAFLRSNSDQAPTARLSLLTPTATLVDSVVVRFSTPNLHATATADTQADEAGAYQVTVESSSANAASGSFTLIVVAHDRSGVLPGDTLDWQAFDRAGDEDRFELAAGASGRVAILLERQPSGTSGGVVLEVLRQGRIGSLEVTHTTNELGIHSLELDVEGGDVLRLTRTGTLSGTVPYRFALVRLDGQPEHRGAAIEIGAMVRGERIDHSADRDVFEVTLSADHWYRLFANLSGQGDRVDFAVRGPSESALADLTVRPGNGTDYETATDRFAGSGDAVTIRVQATGAVGTYEFFLAEFASAEPTALDPEGTWLQEQLGPDTPFAEYVMTKASQSHVRVWSEADPGIVVHRFSLDFASDLPTRNEYGWAQGGLGIRVAPAWEDFGNSGAYELVGRRFELDVPGDSNDGVSSELSPASDADLVDFGFVLKRHQPIRLTLTVSPPSDGALHDLRLRMGERNRPPVLDVDIEARPDGEVEYVFPRYMGEGTSGRWILQETSNTDPDLVIPYEAVTEVLDDGPEANDSIRVVGDSIGEAIDAGGDVDHYHIEDDGSALRRLRITFDAANDGARLAITSSVRFDSETGEDLGGTVLDEDDPLVLVVPLQTGQSLDLWVHHPDPVCTDRPCIADFSESGSYWIKIEEVGD